jgi:hypothetical protein
MTRWVSSEYEAILRLIKSYDLIVEDLKNISSSEDFDSKTKIQPNLCLRE